MKTSEQKQIYTAGTLKYSTAALFSLFGWMLWGDFVLTLMEAVEPSLMPILLKDAGASNRQIGFLMSSAAFIVGLLLGPFISTKSDNFRSRWGRRRPFLFLFSPFVVLFLCAVPYSRQLLDLLSFHPFMERLLNITPLAPAVLVLGILIIGYQIFNVPVMTAFYCLVPDVVPKPVIGRFYALFRVFGTLAGIMFNYFILGKVNTHLHEIFIGIGIIYLIAIWLMCYKVKEGEYPPLPPKEDRKGWVDSIKSYFSECYGKKYWWIVYLAYAGLYWSYLSNGFTIFFYRDQLGLTVDAYGKLVAYGSMVTLALFYPFGMLMDWWGSHKTLMAGVLSAVIIFLSAFFFIHTPAQGRVFLIITGVPTALSHVTILKWLADVYPPSRYGQHNSAAVLFFSIGGVFLGSFCGYLLDLLKDYRYVFVWTAFFRAVTFFSVLWIFYHKPVTTDSISKTDSNLSCGH